MMMGVVQGLTIVIASPCLVCFRECANLFSEGGQWVRGPDHQNNTTQPTCLPSTGVTCHSLEQGMLIRNGNTAVNSQHISFY